MADNAMKAFYVPSPEAGPEVVVVVRAAICRRAACDCDDDARVCVGQAKAAIDAYQNSVRLGVSIGGGGSGGSAL
jgi:hypothetical protein